MKDSRLIVVMGVSGSGKTSLAQAIANTLNWSFVEADDFHSEVNKQKMAKGIALNDADRLPWINMICRELFLKADSGSNCVLSFSGLKSTHRQMLRELNAIVAFLYIDLSQAVIASRLNQRENHFFNPKLLDSQFKAMEDPSNEADIIRLTDDLELNDLLALSFKQLKQSEFIQ
ncbi:AAA family ATPase [Aliikangiella marina]|uniref:Gluconokinase n=1 Tax=Aliikangiella marina TaxID=1712262 RepID=A0A545T177_9GAMM|nr:gluconokinase, GntK/IdnK-type [Aliikangiella marina]TQV70976.1 AAA family ATPase [Aliikangiella marina]